MADDFRITAVRRRSAGCWTRAPRWWPSRISATGRVTGTALGDGPVASASTPLSGVELGENLRFEPGEKRNDPAFVASLIEGFDVYVNEAFGVAHRPMPRSSGRRSSCPAPPGCAWPARSRSWGASTKCPARPFVAVVGGAKVADKIEVLYALATKVDCWWSVEAWPSPSWPRRGAAWGVLFHAGHLNDCRALLDSGLEIVQPTDIRGLEPGGTFGAGGIGSRGGVKVIEGIFPTGESVGIGPDSAAAFADVVRQAGTVLWNGPLGAFEDARFAGARGWWPRRWPSARASPSWVAGTAPVPSKSSGCVTR